MNVNSAGGAANPAVPPQIAGETSQQQPAAAPQPQSEATITGAKDQAPVPAETQEPSAAAKPDTAQVKPEANRPPAASQVEVTTKDILSGKLAELTKAIETREALISSLPKDIQNTIKEIFRQGALTENNLPDGLANLMKSQNMANKQLTVLANLLDDAVRLANENQGNGKLAQLLQKLFPDKFNFSSGGEQQKLPGDLGQKLADTMVRLNNQDISPGQLRQTLQTLAGKFLAQNTSLPKNVQQLPQLLFSQNAASLPPEIAKMAETVKQPDLSLLWTLLQTGQKGNKTLPPEQAQQKLLDLANQLIKDQIASAPKNQPAPTSNQNASTSPNPTPTTSATPNAAPNTTTTTTTTTTSNPNPIPNTNAATTPNPAPNTSVTMAPNPIPNTSAATTPNLIPNTNVATTPNPIPNTNAATIPNPIPNTNAATIPNPIPNTNAATTPNPIPTTNTATTPNPIPNTNTIPNLSATTNDNPALTATQNPTASPPTASAAQSQQPVNQILTGILTTEDVKLLEVGSLLKNLATQNAGNTPPLLAQMAKEANMPELLQLWTLNQTLSAGASGGRNFTLPLAATIEQNLTQLAGNLLAGNISAGAAKDGLDVLMSSFKGFSQLGAEEEQLARNFLKQTLTSLPPQIQQAAAKYNMPELPRAWLMTKLANLDACREQAAAELKLSAANIRTLSAAVQRSAVTPVVEHQSGNSVLSFTTPLYFGEGQAYPAHIHIYQEYADGGSPFARRRKKPETWVRITVDTENIGPVDAFFRLYDQHKLDVRVRFQEPGTASEFGEYLPEIRRSMKNSSLELTDLSVRSSS